MRVASDITRRTTITSMQVIVYVGVSIDGFIARPDGAVDFLDAGEPPTDDMGFGALLERVDVLVMGRNTFDFVLGFDWPYGDLPVRVATSRPIDLAPDFPGDVAAVSGSPAEIIAALEAEGFTTAYVDGGAVAAAFFADDLVDELALTFVPVVIGEGISLITSAPHDLGFSHRSTTSDPNGFVQIWWERNRSETPPVS